MQCSLCKVREAEFMVEELRPPSRWDRASPSAFRFAACRSCLQSYLERLASDEGFTSIKIERLAERGLPR